MVRVLVICLVICAACDLWRLTNCFGFAAVNVFLLLPQLLSLTAQPNAIWDSPKLRFVASGCTFFVALGLALAAQFGLRKVAHASSSPLRSAQFP
jgi:hypothetical protein